MQVIVAEYMNQLRLRETNVVLHRESTISYTVQGNDYLVL